MRCLLTGLLAYWLTYLRLAGMLIDEMLQPHHRVAVRLGMLLQKHITQQLRRHAELKSSKDGAKKSAVRRGLGLNGEVGDGLKDVNSESKWESLVARTDELYVVHEHLRPTFELLMKKLAIEVARDDLEAKLMAKDLVFATPKDPVRLVDKAAEEYEGRFDDGVLPEACVPDITRCRIVLQSGTQIKELVTRIIGGVQLGEVRELGILHLASHIPHLTSYILHLTSYIYRARLYP